MTIFVACILVLESNAALQGTNSVCHSLPDKKAGVVCEPGGSAWAFVGKSGRVLGMIVLMESPHPEVEAEQVQGALESEDT